MSPFFTGFIVYADWPGSKAMRRDLLLSTTEQSLYILNILLITFKFQIISRIIKYKHSNAGQILALKKMDKQPCLTCKTISCARLWPSNVA